MQTWLFPNFLDTPTRYAEAEKFWEVLWDGVLKASHPGRPWQTPWMKNPDRDGNPIFTAVCPDLQRGVLVIQSAPKMIKGPSLTWWISSFGEKTAPDAIRELVIACCPSRENTAEMQRLMTNWVESGEVATTANGSNGLPPRGALDEFPSRIRTDGTG